MSFRLVPKSVTLNDLERRNGLILRYFSEFRYSFQAHCVKVHVRYLISWWVLVSLCQLTTLAIHNSLSRLLPAQDLPLSQTFPTIDSLPASGLTPRTLLLTVSSEHLGFLFLVSSLLFFSFGSVQMIRLAIRLSACGRTYNCIVSYRISCKSVIFNLATHSGHYLKCSDGRCYVTSNRPIWAANSQENH